MRKIKNFTKKIKKQNTIEKLLEKLNIHIFHCKDGNPIAIDTKKFRYFITNGEIKKIPQHQMIDKFGWEISDLQKSIFNSEIKVLKFKQFWKGFSFYPFDVKEEIYRLTNRIELLEEDKEAINLYLDSISAPKNNPINGEKYSIVGRIKNK
jgi:hypothetical protein